MTLIGTFRRILILTGREMLNIARKDRGIERCIMTSTRSTTRMAAWTQGIRPVHGLNHAGIYITFMRDKQNPLWIVDGRVTMIR